MENGDRSDEVEARGWKWIGNQIALNGRYVPGPDSLHRDADHLARYVDSSHMPGTGSKLRSKHAITAAGVECRLTRNGHIPHNPAVKLQIVVPGPRRASGCGCRAHRDVRASPSDLRSCDTRRPFPAPRVRNRPTGPRCRALDPSAPPASPTP